MRNFVILAILFIPLLFTTCDEALLSELDTVATDNEEQDARLDSLLTIITDQQAYIDSLNNAQHVADSLDNLTLQAYIDSLINAGNVSDSLIQVYVDSLNTIQNTLLEDCAGVAGGTATEDNCGVCDSDLTNNCVPDCAGVWGGDNSG